MTVGDYSQPLTISVTGINLLLTDTQVINLRKPDGTEVVLLPDAITSNSMTYTFVPGDLDQDGTYCGDVVLTWGILVTGPGQVTSSVFSFQVSPGL